MMLSLGLLGGHYYLLERNMSYPYTPLIALVVYIVRESAIYLSLRHTINRSGKKFTAKYVEREKGQLQDLKNI